MYTKKTNLLLLSQDLLVEVLLDLLVGVIYAQLLEAVCIENLKSRDIQDADCASCEIG
jgi:hypothetical protein